MADKLKELLGEEIYNTHVAPKLGTEKKYFFGEGDFIPKGRFDEVNNQTKTFKEQLAERDKQLETLQKSVKGNEELTKQIQDLQDANKKQVEDFQTQLAKQEKDFAIKSAVSQSNAKNPDVFMKMLDFGKINIKDGALEGYKEQEEAFKQSDAYLFNEDITPVPPKRAGNPVVPPIHNNNQQTQNQQAFPKKPWNRHKI